MKQCLIWVSFNEAGAMKPRKTADADLLDSALNGFNEAGAMKPRKTGLSGGRSLIFMAASMRPGR